jgi:hypothetical protein
MPETSHRAAINAIGYNNKLAGYLDYSGGANSWDGIDLVSTKWKNVHRTYTWSTDSKNLLKEYKKENNGGVKVAGFKYQKKGFQISATKIIGKTLYTHLTTGRGEKKTDPTKFE